MTHRNPKYSRRNPYSVGKQCARQRGLEWTLTQEQYRAVMGDRRCFYCAAQCPPSAGALDRVDTTKGYTADNVVPCCQKCNSKKRGMPQSIFMAEGIYAAYAEADGSPGGEA